jgi:hypothetical protein
LEWIVGYAEAERWRGNSRFPSGMTKKKSKNRKAERKAKAEIGTA